VKAGDEVHLTGHGGPKKTVVTGIEAFARKLKEAKEGDKVGLLLRDLSKEDVQRGDELWGRDPQFTSKP
jgi:elongation factor Tu